MYVVEICFKKNGVAELFSAFKQYDGIVMITFFTFALQERKSADPINFTDCVRNVKEDATDYHNKFLTSLKQMCKTKTKYSSQSTDTEK